ncbi:hypothetical protein diail_10958 [Diaporthe ilicicola]|nr:hypothetical protein diail_10958 [Diaporthe ilicicola]
MAASSSEWNQYRGIITHCYITRNMSLPLLMHEMEANHDFRAKAKVYRAHFRQWGLQKNMNLNRAVAALSSGDANQERARSYISRLPAFFRQQALRQPSASPQRSLDPSDDLSVVENCIQLLSHQVNGSFESGVWPKNAVTGAKYEMVVPEWCTSVMSAAWVLKEGRGEEAQLLLTRFLSECHSQLQRHDPLIFAFMYTSVLYFTKEHPAIAWLLLRKFRSVAEELSWPRNHPARLLFLVLYQMGPDQMVVYANKILLTYVDLIHGALGGAYAIVQDMLSDAMMRLLSGGLMSPEQVADLGQNMCEKAERENRHQNEYYFNLRLHMANARLLMGDKDATKHLLDEITAPRNKDIRDPRILVAVNRTMARLHESDGAISEAIECLMRSIVLTLEIDGEHGPHLVNGLILLAKMYERSGQAEKAQRVREDRDATLKSLCEMTGNGRGT